MKKINMFLVAVLTMIITGCSGGGGSDPAPLPLSSEKAITAFNFASPAATGVITEATHTIAITVPFGTAVTGLIPTITHTGASISPASGVEQDFTAPVVYTVTAADATTRDYTVTVVVPPTGTPKTGQTTSYATDDDGYLQKGVAWPDPRFTVGTGAEIDCVTDNLTGLMWVKSAGSTTGTWQAALTHANELDLCGHTDWRLPNRKELRTLINYGVSENDVWLTAQGFIGVQAGWHWSSSTYATWTDLAWIVSMGYGLLGSDSKTSGGYVWPVRAGQ